MTPLTFALMTEGETDQVVLENLLLGYFKDQGLNSDSIRWDQPEYIAKSSHTDNPSGGWKMLFQSLREKKHQESLQFASYLVIQVDTDIVTQPEFGLDAQLAAVTTPDEIKRLVEAVIARLAREMGSEDYDYYRERLLFAVCVHEMECWLLPLWAGNPMQTSLSSCDNKLAAAFYSKTKLRLVKSRKSNSYANASRGFHRKKDLLQAVKKQTSLSLFCERLSQI